MQNGTSSERTATDLTLFAVGFIGFLISSGGVATASAPAAAVGAILLLVVVMGFSLRAE